MNGNKLLIDTNIVLYLLGGDTTCAEVLEGKNIFLSFISELELLSYQSITQSEQHSTQATFLRVLGVPGVIRVPGVMATQATPNS